MTRYRTLSVLLLVVGSVLMIFSAFRWLQIYNDPSSAFFGILSGLLFILIGYLNQRVCDHYEEIQELHRAIDIMNQLMDKKFKKLNLDSLSEKPNN